MAKKASLLITISVMNALLSPAIAHSHVPPASQIIGFMAKRFKGLKALRITQLTTIRDVEHEDERALGEIIEVVSPNLYRSEVLGEFGARLTIHSGSRTLKIVDNRIASDSRSNEFAYRFLLLDQTPERIRRSLQGIGVNLDKVSLTRLDGTVTYMIGEREGGNPKLLVDKYRFLPLLLSYANLCFRFSDYREIMENTWYPHHIIRSSSGVIVEEYRAKDIDINPPVDVTQFSIPLIRNQFEKSE